MKNAFSVGLGAVLGLWTQFKDLVIVGPGLINISYLKGLSTFIANLSPSFNFNDL